MPKTTLKWKPDVDIITIFVNLKSTWVNSTIYLHSDYVQNNSGATWLDSVLTELAEYASFPNVGST